MDRTRLVSTQAQEQQRGIVRRSLERLVGGAIVIGGAALKWGFVFGKFAAFFVSFAAYSFWFGSWQFGLGFVLLILVHELGHVAEARRQGLPVSLPTFIPFFGAFVTVRNAGLAPWRNALVSLAGPVAGGLAAAVVWGMGASRGITWLVVLANLGFLLNAFNLLPIGFLDGGAISRAISQEWHLPRIRYENGVPMEAFAPDRRRAATIAFLYAAVAAGLVAGMLATRHSGML
jgi:Zn-dependent protease